MTKLTEKKIRTYLKNISEKAKDELVVKLLLTKSDEEFIIQNIEDFNQLYGGEF